MSPTQIALILLCVIALAIGQLLFKISARSLVPSDTIASVSGLFLNPVFLLSLATYGAATLLWVWLLRKIPLAAAYPFFALSFAIVPLLSGMFLGERTGMAYWIGIALIIVGIVVTAL